jgi:transcriptional regulator with XRE-family HTH domain
MTLETEQAMTSSGPRPSLGQMIRARRFALGMSQEALAARVSDLGSEITQADVSRIELGKVELPRRRRLEHLAAALELSLGELLEASGWVGAGQIFAAATPQPVSPPRASSAPEPSLLEEPGTSHQPALAPLSPAGPDAFATLDAILRLRTAITQAHEPVARAARLLQDCQRTALRWDPTLTPDRVVARRLKSGHVDRP